MSTITLTKESHATPEKFRIKHQDSLSVLGPDATTSQTNAKTTGKTDAGSPPIQTRSKVGIIGGGFAGIGAAIKTMQELNEHDLLILERHDNFGGTWYANTYPGCASDIPALWYSFSFALASNWSRLQPPQYEMEEYLLRVVDMYKLRDKVQFRTYIDRCVFDDKQGEWTLFGHDMQTGQLLEHKCSILLGCSGGLVHPRHLQVEGLDSFKGKYMHSAVWDHSVDFKGKRVVVVGNGCSANQTVPALLNDPQYNAGSITQIFRSKHYILPPLPAALMWLYWLLSFSYYGLFAVRLLVVAIAEGKFLQFKGDGYIANWIRRVRAHSSTEYVKKHAPKKYHEQIIPDWTIGCKRMIFDYNYIPSLHDPRIDLRSERIKKVVPEGVILENDELIPCDIIVACTGYDLEKSLQLPVMTSSGASMNEIWSREGPTAYRTIMVKEVPNFFLMSGPNAGTGHSSVVMSIENAIDFYLKVAKPILQGKEKSVVVKTQAYDTWHKDIQHELKSSIFGTPLGGCVSWYNRGGHNHTTYPWSQIHYWYVTHFPNYTDLSYSPSSSSKNEKSLVEDDSKKPKLD
ncbi:uncharacterized protein LODBEIA_P16920 [Lodderomyces beijingensis]|uniref:Uncharacterized protein n=1 Tax=Lodderomyces beijingensis TaxID=1775926 RepID=A0ABP0ZH22_9ASCO